MPREMALEIASVEVLRCIVWLHGPHDIAPDDWSYAMDRVKAAKQSCADDLHRLRFLVVTDGGAPNAPQRTELFSRLLEGRVRCAAVSCSLDNPLKRGIVTAITWLNRDFKAVLPEQFDAGIAFLGITQIAPVWRTLLALQSSLPLNRSLLRVAKTYGYAFDTSSARNDLASGA